MKQNSFLIMSSWEESINLLSNDDKVTFLKYLFKYHNGLEVDTFTDSPTLKIFWKSIEPTLKINRDKFINKINNAREIGERDKLLEKRYNEKFNNKQ